MILYMSNNLVLKAKATHFQGIVSALSTSMESLPSSINKEAYSNAVLGLLQQEIEDGHVYVCMHHYRVAGFVIVSTSIEDSLYPKSRYSKSADLLDEIGFLGENTMVLRWIFVDYALQRNGIGTEIFQSLNSFFPKSTWFFASDKANESVAKYIASLGFVSLGERNDLECASGPMNLFYKKYRPSGLCREALW